MSSTETGKGHSGEAARAATVETKLEVIVIPVSDVDRAKRFYGSLGWRWTPISPRAKSYGWCN
jgi:hypothetical protein